MAQSQKWKVSGKRAISESFMRQTNSLPVEVGHVPLLTCPVTRCNIARL
jgi:hypothetical protein